MVKQQQQNSQNCLIMGARYSTNNNSNKIKEVTRRYWGSSQIGSGAPEFFLFISSLCVCICWCHFLYCQRAFCAQEHGPRQLWLVLSCLDLTVKIPSLSEPPPTTLSKASESPGWRYVTILPQLLRLMEQTKP